ncbi:uncharacterized protein G2W53_006769 [Senna tora]|uniref:Uncharacterized protein n=1 Tax=Senna tora TaxID=362788 RepID=A0A834X5S5_9FABA|nr:uncharacterized protein G2W53_006769 [Senna tora]
MPCPSRLRSGYRNEKAGRTL